MERNMKGCLVLAALWFVLTGPEILAQRNDLQVVEAPTLESAEPLPGAPDTAAPGEPTLKDVMEELSRLREEVAQLRDLLDARLGGEVTDLRNENERLRREVQSLSIPKESPQRHLPMPDKELLQGLTEPEPRPKRSQETKPIEKPSETARAPEAAKASPPAEFTHVVLAEWGRSPAEAAKSFPKAGSLKGMICVVPAGSRDEDLVTLAQSLHKKFASYDNINIEVFDDAEAARAFKENRFSASAPLPSDHRVLSISKHAASGRDVILLIKGQQTTEVPLE
jgi:hypothetical protein